MVRKIALLLLGLAMLLLGSCSRADTLNEEAGNLDTLPALHEEMGATADGNIDGEIITPPDVAIEYQESVIGPICERNRCPGCVPLYIAGEYVQPCEMQQKYNFSFYGNVIITYCGHESHGALVDNWWRPNDIRPSKGISSDRTTASFVIQNDRIVGVSGAGLGELTTTQWDDWGIQIFQYAGDVTLIGMPGTISQMPEFHEDSFISEMLSFEDYAGGREILYIFHHELLDSKLWNLLMGYQGSILYLEQSGVDPVCIRNECPGCVPLYIDGEYIPPCDIRRQYVFSFHRPFRRPGSKIDVDGRIVANYRRSEGIRPARSYSFDFSFSGMTVGWLIFQDNRIVVDGGIRELTTTQWDDWEIQIFQYAGDITLIGMPGSISQIPEFQEDTFLFPLEYHACGRENQYILYHELPESRLWKLLMGHQGEGTSY